MNSCCELLQDQAAGLVLYLQRIYHNFISQGPIASQQSTQGGMRHAVVVHHFPVRLDGLSGGYDYVSAAIAVASMEVLPLAMEAVDKQLLELGTCPSALVFVP